MSKGYIPPFIQKYIDQIMANVNNAHSSYQNYYDRTGAYTGIQSNAALRESSAYASLPEYLRPYFGGEKSVEKGEALGGATLMQADLQRQMNRLAYSDAISGMQDAGINPMVFGQNGMQQPATAEPQSIQPMNTGVDQLTAGLQSVATVGQLATQIAGVTKASKDMKLTDQKAIWQSIQNEIAKDTKEAAKRIVNGQAELQDKEILLKGYEAQSAAVNAHIAETYGIEKAEWETKTAQWNSMLAKQTNEWYNRLTESIVNLNEANAQEAFANVAKLGAEAGFINKQTSQMDQKLFIESALCLAQYISACTGASSSMFSMTAGLEGLSGSLQQSGVNVIGNLAQYLNKANDTMHKYMSHMYAAGDYVIHFDTFGNVIDEVSKNAPDTDDVEEWFQDEDGNWVQEYRDDDGHLHRKVKYSDPLKGKWRNNPAGYVHHLKTGK